MKNAINWFEIPAADFDRAVKFYDAIMNKPLRRESFGGMPHAVFSSDAEGVGGAVSKMDRNKPSSHGSMVYLNVEGYLDKAVENAAKAGGKILSEKMSIGENGFVAIIADTEGNTVGLHSMK